MFDEVSPFVERGVTGAWSARLNWRFDAIVRKHASAFETKRILDLGCHDGRWMHAALRMGARHVLGVEGRERHLVTARANLAFLGHDPSTYDFLHSDLRYAGEWQESSVDTVLLLGVLYHLPGPVDVLARVAGMAPKTILIDSAVTPDLHPVIRLKIEDARVAGNGLAGEDARAIVGRPSESAVTLVLRHHGYTATVYRWAFPDPQGEDYDVLPVGASPLRDYVTGHRIIILAERERIAV